MIDDQRAFQQSYYDRHYPKRVAVVREQLGHPLFRSFYDRLAAQVLDLCVDPRPGQLVRIFEAGCGEGFLGSAIRRVADRRGLSIEYAGADLSQAALDLARPTLGDDLHVGDATDVASRQPSLSRDLFIVKNLLHHLEDPASLLKEAARVVAPNGRVAVIEARQGCPQFWVFGLLAPRRERYFFKGARRNLAAIDDAGLRIVKEALYGFLPYELLFHVRFRLFRRLFSTDDPATIDRVSRVDSRLARALPWFSSYVVWAAEPVGSSDEADLAGRSRES